MPLKVVPRRDRKLNRLIKAATPVDFRKGQAIFGRGDEADSVYLVREGHVRLTLPHGGKEKERTVAVAGPGELFGEDSITRDIPRRYTAVAGSTCVLLALSGVGVFKALRGSPKTLDTFLASFDRDLAAARGIAGSAGPPSRARIADVLLDLAYRFGDDDGRRIRLEHWFTHQELADLAGAHRSTVTTTLNDWIYEGILRQGPKALIVSKPGALRSAASEALRERPRDASTR
jgi:CRP-like cAMP-binding protein